MLQVRLSLWLAYRALISTTALASSGLGRSDTPGFKMPNRCRFRGAAANCQGHGFLSATVAINKKLLESECGYFLACHTNWILLTYIKICHHSGIQGPCLCTIGDMAKVLFHPAAVHSVYAEGPPDPADFTIRAPFPTVHLLRSLDELGVGVKGLVDVL